jgi:D-alanyl-D-alanine carboxypeptidase
MIEEMDQELITAGEEIQKLVAVTGVDAGTIRSRLRGEQFENKGVVKTGTTNPVSALAGMLSTKSGRRYFAIFNHRWAGLSSSPLRAFQNRVARKLMSDFGGGEAFDYTPKSIYPVDELMSEQ